MYQLLKLTDYALDDCCDSCIFLSFSFFFNEQNALLTFSLYWIRLRVWPSDRNLPTFILTRSKGLPAASSMNSGTCEILFYTHTHTHIYDYIEFKSMLYDAEQARHKDTAITEGAWLHETLATTTIKHFKAQN